MEVWVARQSSRQASQIGSRAPRLAKSDLPEVCTGALGDRKRLIERCREHVLLHNAKADEVEIPKDITKGQEIDSTVCWLDKHIQRNRLSEGNTLRRNLSTEFAIDVLEMQIRNPAVVSPHETYGVTAAVGVMPSIQEQRDQVWLAGIKQRLYLVFILHVSLGMRMEDELKSVVRAGDLGNSPVSGEFG